MNMIDLPPGQGKTEPQDEVHACCICGTMFRGFGNNPEPIRKFEDGRCCDECNVKIVIPARMTRVQKGLNPRG